MAQAKSGNPKGKVVLQVYSRTKEYTLQVEAYIMPQLTGKLPIRDIANQKIADWTHLTHLVLADPEFYRSSDIDIILGADVFGEVMLEDRVSGKPGMPMAYNSQFGWVITGKAGDHQSGGVSSFHIVLEPYDPLKRFWELEELHQKPPLTPEETNCESHFVTTVKRNDKGRYCVQLPFKENSGELGLSQNSGIRRFLYLEKRLQSRPTVREQYHSFMNEYHSLGHMELIPVQEHKEIANETNYFPQHVVLKEDSPTTKLRVVFDASAKTTSGVSLNDKLMVGPKLQEDIWDILLRFRLHRYAVSADIEKMFRQIQVTKRDGDFQRVIWRSSPEKELQHYRLVTVAYGTASAPFLAQRTLQQLAEDEGERFPLARRAVLQDFYMDNVLTGSRELSEARELQQQLVDMTSSAGFVLRQWASNDPNLLSTLPAELCGEKKHYQVMHSDEKIKTLGVFWNTEKDTFFYDVHLPAIGVISKRTVLSDIGRLFDPLGWLSPVTVSAKILMQKLWLAGVDWDEPLSPGLSSEWCRLRQQIPEVQKIQIPRCITIESSDTTYTLHGFADASEMAYGAVLYLVSVASSGKLKVSLLCAKTRVAPVKQVSLPRLELCAAVLLCQLTKKVQVTLSVTIHNVYLWSDSMVVLGWIQGLPRRWKTFVANRVTQIQSAHDPACWHYVPSGENPADVASRGCSPLELCAKEVWFRGPEWLREKSSWPKLPLKLDHELCATEEKVQCHRGEVTIMNKEPWEVTVRFSTLTRLKRVSAYCLRFIRNCKKKSTKTRLRRTVGNTILTIEEMTTVLCQIEASLNSRPLYPLSDDPSDFQILTPGHFLIGEPLSSTPEPSLSKLQLNRLSRWQLVQRMKQSFWTRWKREYLSQLQQRKKWTKKENNLKCGDLVLLKDESLPPLTWARGRVVETHPGADGLVRVVTIKTASGLFKRPVAKLCLLSSEC